jgi:hypothetical protein
VRKHFQQTKTDCFRCCVASILGFDSPHSVPDWYSDLQPGEPVPEEVLDQQRDWFAARGLALIETRYTDPDIESVVRGVGFVHPGLPCIVVGRASRGMTHAAIYRDGALVFDPHHVYKAKSAPETPGIVGLPVVTHGTPFLSIFMIGLNVGDPYWKANLIRNLPR